MAMRMIHHHEARKLLKLMSNCVAAGSCWPFFDIKSVICGTMKVMKTTISTMHAPIKKAG